MDASLPPPPPVFPNEVISDMNLDDENDNSSSPFGWARVPVIDEGRVPCQRSLHSAAVWNDCLYIFGGYDGHTRVNDMYEYDFSLRRWNRIVPSLLAPPPRDRHVAVVNNNSFYVFGGFDGSSRVNDFWEYNFETQDWSQVVASGIIPSPRHSHMAVTYKGCMYVFGGYDGSYRGDFHEFNFQTQTWSLIQPSGTPPRCRYRASCVVHKDLMIMFGGHDGTRHLNDTNIYNFITQSWTMLTVTPLTPSPRDSHIAVVFKDSMFIFGGSTGEATDELHELKLSKSRCQWNLVNNKSPLNVEWDHEYDNEDDVVTSDAYAIPSGDSVDHEGEINDDRNRYLASIGSYRHTDSESINESILSGSPSRSVDNNNSNLNIPGPRFCHIGSIHKDCLYIFGGYDGTARLNDFIRYRFGSLQSIFKVGPSTLNADLKSMVNQEELSDVTFNLDGNTHVYAHKFMLVRCQYFRAMLLGDMAEAESKVISLPNISQDTMLKVLEYIYTDCVKIHIDDAMDIFQAADQFNISRLRSMCENVMLKSISVANAATILYAADMFSAKALRQRCIQFIGNNFWEVTKTQAFEEMGRNNIELLFEVLRINSKENLT